MRFEITLWTIRGMGLAIGALFVIGLIQFGIAAGERPAPLLRVHSARVRTGARGRLSGAGVFMPLICATALS